MEPDEAIVAGYCRVLNELNRMRKEMLDRAEKFPEEFEGMSPDDAVIWFSEGLM